MKKIGRYDIVEELGRGAMGVVYKASDPTIGRLVAIKVLTLDPSTEEGIPGAREIFMREARAAGRLSHPGIVTIHDALEDPETQVSFIVMEFISGRTLENILLSETPLETDQALDIIGQVAEALDYAHHQQVIHRDLKPANILLTEAGRAKITDFGIAKITARESALRTVAIMGTPSYMSPEQVTGKEIDGRSDLFSLGVLLYLMLTGEKPFTGDTAAVMFKIVYQDPLPPSQLKPQLGLGHDYLAIRCLAKDRNKRYASAREFLDDLEDVQHGHAPRSEAHVSLAELRTGERTMISRASAVRSEAEMGIAPATKRPTWIIAALSAMALCLVTLLGWSVWRYHQPRPSPTAPAAAQPRATPLPSPPSSLPPSLSGTSPAASATAPVPLTKASPSHKEGEAGANVAAKPPSIQNTRARAENASTTPAQSGATIASATVSTSPPLKAGIASPRPAMPPPTRPPGSGVAATLWCKHELKEGTLTVSSGTVGIFTVSLKGKKLGGFLGLKGGYTGALSRPFKIPTDAQELSVRVVSKDGSVDLSNTVSATPPSGSSPILKAVVTHDQLTLNWRGTSHLAP